MIIVTKKKKIRIKDFKNKKVTIMGLGLHGGGVGVAKFFTKIGAKVLITDLRNKEELAESIEKLNNKPVKYVLGQHRSEDFINTDLVIKNPAVPDNSRYLEIAKEHRIPIETDMGIFFELCPAPIIGITGTKGKSTVASLIYRFLKRKYPEVVLAGNIRASVLEKLFKITKESLVVLELSSWQLAGLRSHKKSPDCSVITNIMPDHLNRYKSMAEYIEDKKEIFRWQKSNDYLVLNYDDKLVRDFAQEAKSQVLYYSQKENKTGQGSLAPKITDEIKLKGQHNISNVLAAVTVAKLYNLSDKSIIKVLNKFEGLEGRLQLIDVINGVKYINDTTATSPEACLAALNSVSPDNDIILIAGGADKKLDFNQLVPILVKKVKTLILLEGSATAKFKKAVEEQSKLTSQPLEIIGPLSSMEQAVLEAKERANEPEAVLLSPACASFGLFRHEFERGEAFAKAVDLLKKLR